ncbi:MAG: site-specific integrase [Methylococcales bacterium]
MKLVYKTERVEFESGEEMYFVVDDKTRHPLEYPVLFAMNKLRKKGDAANTLNSKMLAIAALYSWAKSSEIDIHERIRNKDFFNEDEIDDLSDFCLMNFKLNTSDAVTKIMATKVISEARSRNTNKIKTIRKIDTPSVSPQTHYMKLGYIAPYLKWLSLRLLNKDAGIYRHDVQEMVELINECRPSRGRADSFNPISIEKEDMEKLYSYAKVDAANNPFKSKGNDARKLKSIKVRNELIFTMLHKLGVRVGELCGIKLKDLHLSGTDGIVNIYRRPTDKNDTRKKRAQVKTEARDLPINGKLAKLINDYATKHRLKVKNANKSEFLFVTHETSKTPEGSPITMDAVRKIFNNLSKVTGIKCTPHSLRHTWNVDFSEMADKEGMSEEREMSLRRYLMGWSENSKMPAHYAKRHTIRKANKAMLKLQNKNTSS